MIDSRLPPPTDSYLLQLASAATHLGVSSIWASLGKEVHSELQSATTPPSAHTKRLLRSRAVPSGHARPSPSAGSNDAKPALEPALPSPDPTSSPFGRSSQPASGSSRLSRGISTPAASIDAPRLLNFDHPGSAASGPAASSPASPWHGAPPAPPIDADRVWPDRAEVAQRQGAVMGADAGVFEVPMQLSNLTMGGPPPRAFNLPRGAKKVGQLHCKPRPGGAAHSAVYLVVGGGGPRRIVDATGRALSPSVGWQALMPTHRLGLECDEYVQVSTCRS